MVIHDKFDFERDLEKFCQEKSSICKFRDDQKFSGKCRDLNESTINTSSLFNKLDEEFSNDFLKAKEKILEQIIEIKEEIPQQDEEVMRLDQHDMQTEVNYNDNIKSEEEINFYFNTIHKETQNLLENKKKQTKFMDLASEIIKKNISFGVADVFYNTLCMAQNREIELKQNEFFNNSSILLKIVK